MSIALTEWMRRISALLQTGQYVAAQSQLTAVLFANPDYVEGLRLLAGTTQALGDLATAEALLRRALALDVAWTPTLTSLAELLLLTGRGAEAVPLLEAAIRGVPRYSRAAFILARHHLNAGRPQAALEVATPWCNGRDMDAEFSALHVAAFAALGRQSEAVAHYRDLETFAPDNWVVKHALATALNAAGQPAESERAVLQALRRTGPTAALHHTHARSLIALERFDDAELALRECIRLQPLLAEAHDSLAQLIWMRTGDIVEATRMLDQALGRFEHEDALWATKAALLLGAGDARSSYSCLVPRAARPQAPPALLIRAGLAALEFEPATSLALARRCLQMQAGNTTARKLMCASYLGVGDGCSALAECETLLELTPDDQYLIAMKTTALRLLGDTRYEDLCDYGELVWSETLETPPGWSDLPSFLDDLSVRLNSLHSPQGFRLLYQSLRGGTETTQDLSRSQDPVIQALFSAFAAPLERYRMHIGQGADPLRRRNRGASRFNGSWSVRLRSSGYHTSHVHPRGWISSACYVQLPNNMQATPSAEGVLSFGAPGVLTTPSLHAELSVRPQVGRLVLFPSYFWHGTQPFHSEQPRLTVAFDVVPVAGPD